MATLLPKVLAGSLCRKREQQDKVFEQGDQKDNGFYQLEDGHIKERVEQADGDLFAGSGDLGFVGACFLRRRNSARLVIRSRAPGGILYYNEGVRFCKAAGWGWLPVAPGGTGNSYISVTELGSKDFLL